MQLRQASSSSLLLCALVLIVTKMTDACSCMPAHYQTLFCRADAVIEGTIKSTSFIYGDNAVSNNDVYGSSMDYSYADLLPPLVLPRYPLFVVYNVTIKEVFKGEEELVGMTTVSVSSAANGAMCGVADLQDGEAYILSGFVWDGELNVGLCSSWVQPVNSLSVFQKRGLKRLYAKSCDDCRICSAKYDNDCLPTEGCMGSYASPCVRRNSACIRNNKGRCSWKNSKYLRLC
ncbi:metalloproteinase inhibitor 1-like [Strongylocentrotus purpuratus]|uniref:NTR domain-containing protein n=1 Tax=Strongylocentrotus purpuratus TaxID=7668 RepID=A0A7M7N0L9_STRPU|nr:metalloproteinase inhibitor 1-like [Strongylocentrotus purpuratus]